MHPDKRIYRAVAKSLACAGDHALRRDNGMGATDERHLTNNRASETEMAMKTSVRSALLALGAAGLSAVMTLPASAQQFKGRGCDNVSTSRDKTPKPDSRCMLTADERYLQEQNRLFAFIHANPPTKTTKSGGTVIYEGRDRNGDGYRIVSTGGAVIGTGSATKFNVGMYGSRGGTKPR